MGNHGSSCSASPPSAKEGPAKARAGEGWKARKPSEWRRAVLWSRRRLTVAKMLHERLGDEAIWLEAEVLEICLLYTSPSPRDA